jgi:hypothetical protein
MALETTRYRPRQRPIASARALPAVMPEFLRTYIQNAEAALAEPFKGITIDGAAFSGLYPIRPTGIATHPIRAAAEAVLSALDQAQRAAIQFPIESDAWRRWSNIHIFTMRHGVCLEAMDPAQRERALALLQASLSAQGFQTARDIMRLNETIAEITDRWEEYGEWLYWLSLFGTPSADEPWGWQIDGHHLIINCFVLGEQVVMTPMFMGSEPVEADAGRYAGTRVFAAEESRGLALARSLTAEQRRAAVLSDQLPPEVFAGAFRDNLELHYQGIRADRLTAPQQELLLDLIETYVGRMAEGHATIKMDEVRRYLTDTHFAWMGEVEEDSVFYYRVHSPVILIEFDHQRGVALDYDVPTRSHIHTVMRTPNGNDYGKDLLRQHYAQAAHHQAARTG